MRCRRISEALDFAPFFPYSWICFDPQTLRRPLRLKYGCPSPSTWRLAVRSLVCVIQTGVPVAKAYRELILVLCDRMIERKHIFGKTAQEFCKIWTDLVLTLEEFLFPNSKPTATQTVEEQQRDESYDVSLVELMRDFVLPHASQIPKESVVQIVSILNRGSILSATTSSPIGMECNRRLREEFARTCFETLLQFSFLGPKGSSNLFIQKSDKSLENGNNVVPQVGLINKLAVTTLLTRFNEVIFKFVEDEKLSGKCPLARHRVAEISFVLKALATLVSSLKKAPAGTVEETVWLNVIQLYPALVNCVTPCCNPVVCRRLQEPLKECLLQYSHLLRSPHCDLRQKRALSLVLWISFSWLTNNTSSLVSSSRVYLLIHYVLAKTRHSGQYHRLDGFSHSLSSSILAGHTANWPNGGTRPSLCE